MSSTHARRLLRSSIWRVVHATATLTFEAAEVGADNIIACRNLALLDVLFCDEKVLVRVSCLSLGSSERNHWMLDRVFRVEMRAPSSL